MKEEGQSVYGAETYGGSKRKFARFGRKVAKAARASENMHAAWRGSDCENMCAQKSDLKIYTHTYIGTSLRTRHTYVSFFPLIAAPSGGGYVSLHRKFRRLTSACGPHVWTVSVLCYGLGTRWARLRKFALPTTRPRDLANLRKYALETSPVADCE